ncbi:hypothetical protein AB6A40_006951 [Gnathostoma spinigerum]|uniref:Uncharacterized protein n=1 Tax=Gnathostoma spinigerum TaxID=75299 RepID=A0ABD6EUK0_9BILA
MLSPVLLYDCCCCHCDVKRSRNSDISDYQEVLVVALSRDQRFKEMCSPKNKGLLVFDVKTNEEQRGQGQVDLSVEIDSIRSYTNLCKTGEVRWDSSCVQPSTSLSNESVYGCNIDKELHSCNTDPTFFHGKSKKGEDRDRVANVQFVFRGRCPMRSSVSSELIVKVPNYLHSLRTFPYAHRPPLRAFSSVYSSAPLIHLSFHGSFKRFLNRRSLPALNQLSIADKSFTQTPVVPVPSNKDYFPTYTTLKFKADMPVIPEESDSSEECTSSVTVSNIDSAITEMKALALSPSSTSLSRFNAIPVSSFIFPADICSKLAELPIADDIISH